VTEVVGPCLVIGNVGCARFLETPVDPAVVHTVRDVGLVGMAVTVAPWNLATLYTFLLLHFE